MPPMKAMSTPSETLRISCATMEKLSLTEASIQKGMGMKPARSRRE